jgi:hypothetical protein
MLYTLERVLTGTSDISTSFKRLQAERRAADSVIRELTPLEDTKDAAVLRDYLVNINMKVEVSRTVKSQETPP